MSQPTPMPLCAVCSDPVDPDEAHSIHETNCPNSANHAVTEDCACDLAAHPECCPAPNCRRSEP